MGSEKFTIRLDTATKNSLQRVAIAKNITESQLIREFIDEGLKANGYRADDERIIELICQAVKKSIDPMADRLAAINAKNSQMAGADFMLLVYLAKLIYGKDNTRAVDEMSQRARLMGAELTRATNSRFEDVFKKALKETEEYM